MLHPAVDRGLDALGGQPFLNFGLDGFHKFLVGGKAGGQLVFNVLVADGVQVLEGEVLQLPFHPLHT